MYWRSYSSNPPEGGPIKLRQVLHADNIVDEKPPTPIVFSSGSAATCVKSVTEESLSGVMLR